MKKVDKNSADGKTAEVAHHTRKEEGLGALEKAEVEVAAEHGNEAPLKGGGDGVSEVEKDRGSHVSEKSGRWSAEDEIRPAKM
jgi:hypothetical protein